MFSESGDRHSEGIAWNNLGTDLHQVRRFDEAITAYERDIAIYIELGDPYRLAEALDHIGRVYADLDLVSYHQVRRGFIWTEGCGHEPGAAL